MDHGYYDAAAGGFNVMIWLAVAAYHRRLGVEFAAGLRLDADVMSAVSGRYPAVSDGGPATPVGYPEGTIRRGSVCGGTSRRRRNP
jgi:hypothetical protein